MPIIVEPEAPQGMTLEELLEELYAQGFDDIPGEASLEKRAKGWINKAYQEICLFKPWPFLEAEYEGVLPFDFSNLGHVMDVVDPANEYRLRFADRRELVRYNPTLAAEGIGERWYMEGEETICVFPKYTGHTFRVRYTVFPEELTSMSQKPIIPSRFQYIIVRGACREAYINHDNYTAAELQKGLWAEGIESMVKALFHRNYDSERRILRTGRNGLGGVWSWR